MPLHVVLKELCFKGFLIKKITSKIIESIFGRNTPHEMKADTPYSEIIKYNEVYPSEMCIPREMCNRLNNHLKRKPTKDEAILTPETLVDMKPFALQIGCLLSFNRFLA